MIAAANAAERNRWTSGRVKHGAPLDGCEQQVAHVGRLDRERPAVAAAAQAERGREHGHHPEHGRAVAEHGRDLRRGRLGVTDLVAQHDHRAPAEDRRDVHAVGEVEPLHITQPARPSRAPEVGERVVHAGRTIAVTTAAGRGRVSSRFPAPACGPDDRDQAPYLVPVDVEAVEIFTSMLALVALAGAVLLVVARLLSSRVPIAREAGSAVADAGPWLSFLVAAGATAGSLYFSEVANYVPCRLCWFQRTAMYPLSVILLVAAIRRDRGARWYVVPIAAAGADRVVVPLPARVEAVARGWSVLGRRTGVRRHLVPRVRLRDARLHGARRLHHHHRLLARVVPGRERPPPRQRSELP